MPILTRTQVAERFNITPAHASRLLRDLPQVLFIKDNTNLVKYTLTDEHLQLLESKLRSSKGRDCRFSPKYSNAIFKITGVGIR